MSVVSKNGTFTVTVAEKRLRIFRVFYATHYILLLDCYVHSFPTILVLSESVILRIITLEKNTYNIYYVLFSAPTLELC